ncbi:MAG: hypothetical protein M3321_05955, partial [Actinomycetota bacterium]|nr:hypothetical protein [Actinomycetota bacterium]
LTRADWRDVERRARRGDRRGWRHRASGRLVPVVAAVALGVAGSAVAVGVDLLRQQERFHARAPDDPARIGPVVEITSGEEWALLGWISEFGVCVDFAIPGNAAFSCGFPVRGAKPPDDASGAGLPIHAVAGTVSGGNLVGDDGNASIFGVVAAEVDGVTVELSDGRVFPAAVHDAPRELETKVRFFVVRLELPAQRLGGAGPVRALNAYADNRLIERVAF